MATNPFAPPRAEVADVVRGGDVAPPLWNPNAAASWSLLLSPAFGSFLHMKNWQALGEPGRAAASKAWFVGSLAVLGAIVLLSAFMPSVKALDGLSRIVSLALLLSWYFASARPQVAFITGRFGTSYPRRGWLKPIAIAIAALFGVVAIAVVIILIVSPRA